MYKEKRDKHTAHNNLNATWHTSFIPPTPHWPTYSEPPTTWCLTPHWFGTGLVNNPGRVYIAPCFLSHPTVYHQPLKIEPIQGSETSANYNLTPGKYPKEHFQHMVSKFKLCILIILVKVWVTPNVSVNTVPKLWDGQPNKLSYTENTPFCYTKSTPAVGRTQPPIKWVWGLFQRE